MIIDADDNDPPMKKTRNTPKRVDYWETNWGKMVNDPELLDPWTTKAKKFRRRFRITFSLFQYLVGLCKDINLFGTIRKGAVPVEIKILIGLRILARGNCGDDIEEMSGIKESSVYYFFKEFIEKFSTAFFDKFVQFPKKDELQKIMSLYNKIGIPGTVGSMDNTHLKWTNCPKHLINGCKGKEK